MNNQLGFPFPGQSHRTQRIMRGGIYLCIALLVMVGVVPQRVQAAPLILVVDRIDDQPAAQACTGAANDCSLRGAIIAANANPGPDTITLPAGTYLLDEVGTGEGAALDGDLDINGDLTINGADQATTIIDGNGAVTLENVFTIDGSYGATMNDLTISGGSGNPVGGMIAFGGLTLNNVTVDSNHGTGSGGGIYTVTALILTNSTVSNNSAANGAGIYVHAGTVTITSSTLSNNIATGPGGAIYQNGGTMVIESTSQILLNQATAGGGIFTGGGTLTVNDSSIHQNQTTSSGGGISIGSSGSVTLNNTTVNENDSTGGGSSGGGIKTYGSLEINGGQVAMNTAGSNGGGISVASAATLTCTDGYIKDNYTTEDPSKGGGINNFSGQVTLDGCVVDANYVSGTASSDSNGGGIYSTDGDLTLTDSKITNNDAYDSGGGVFFSNGNLTITNSVFQANTLIGSAGAGGGLYNGSFSTAIIKQTEFSGNIASASSGGIHSQSSLTLENVTISGNSAPIGAGIVSTGGVSVTTSIVNSTIYGNVVPSGPLTGGLAAYNDVIVKNTIIAGNSNDECLNNSGTAITSSGYNISGDNTCGFGATGDQINTDPLLGPLADNGGLSKTHALLPGSPAIDAGTNSGCPAIDQRGYPRPVDANLDSLAMCDIGAVEIQFTLFLPLIMR